MTKCRTTTADDEAVDLDYFKQTVKDQLMEDLLVEQRKYASFSAHRSTLYSKAAGQEPNSIVNLKPSLIEQDFEATEKFYQYFTDNLLIFDPLDREIANDAGKNQATKRSQMRKIISKLPKIEGIRTRKLGITLKNDQFETLDQLFREQIDQCKQLAYQYL